MRKFKSLVVVVDNDEQVCRAIKRLLRSSGFASETFRAVDQLLEMIDLTPSFRPACIVLDIGGPGLTGLDAHHRLADSGIPVIVMTARDEIGLREQALASGAIAYLRKPFNGQILIKAVQMAINGSP